MSEANHLGYPSIRYTEVCGADYVGDDRSNIKSLESKILFTGDHDKLVELSTAILAYRETSDAPGAKNIGCEAVRGDIFAVRFSSGSKDNPVSEREAIEANRKLIMGLLDVLDEKGMTSRDERPNGLVTTAEKLSLQRLQNELKSAVRRALG